MRFFARLFGDPALFHEQTTALYQQYLPMLRRRCRRFLRDDALVEDALQEVFTAMYRGIEQFRGEPAQALPWLYRITTTQCLRLIEKEQRWLRCAELSWEEGTTMVDEWQPGGGSDAEKQAVVAQMLSRLPASEREALVLRYVSGLGQDEIAEVMDVSRNQVRRWLSSAEDKGRRMLSAK